MAVGRRNKLWPVLGRLVDPSEATAYTFGRPEQGFQPEIPVRSTFTRLNFGYGENKRGLAGKWVYVVDDKIAQSEPLEFEAYGNNGGYISGVFFLLCDTQARAQILPQACQLRKLSVLQEAVFDQVGYNLLRFCGPRTCTPSELIKQIKIASSKWLKTKDARFAKFHWQSGYEIFSISPSHRGDLEAYIGNQEEHHRRVTFQEEYRRLLKKYEIQFDENHVWD